MTTDQLEHAVAREGQPPLRKLLSLSPESPSGFPSNGCSLKVIGFALAIFAAGEPLSVADQTPTVLLLTRPTASTITTVNPPSFHSCHSPTPPPPHPAVPISRSQFVSSSKPPPILSAESLNHH
ncbi:hypothetical protein SSX86_032640 [Deinandra increscens subsp. villosa]|uniref:Uncharacterized protein n=1 Tax=Deinandra increscens subsp. villosa TaxID=3103831 RepID=A0AAP0C7H2_9ASTR